MALSTLQTALQRYQHEIYTALQNTVHAAQTRGGTPELAAFYGQMRYHQGWVDAHFSPTQSNPGKLLRPTLLLLAYEAAGAWELAHTSADKREYLQRALPAAVAIELTHNFSLIHDDIEDSDAERRHRPTLWKVWGIPQALNTGDGMFALARLALWGVLEQGVEGSIAARLGAALDEACLVLAEGQHLDISFEQRQDVSVAMYVDMIGRKTGALMGCAAKMGALLGTRDQETIERFQSFGRAMGIAFQVRDDILGVWASTVELGKTAAGDISRRKKSLPFLHTLEHATPHDLDLLQTIYQQEQVPSPEQVASVLAVLERTQTKAYCRHFLAQQCQLAHEALASIPRNSSSVSARALDDMEALVHFVEATAS